MDPQLQRFRHRTLPVVCLMTWIGCTSGVDPAPPDVGRSDAVDARPGTDVEVELDGSLETDVAVPAEDAGLDASTPDASTPDASTTNDVGLDCRGPCLELDLLAEVGSASAMLDHAIYGLTAPEQSGSGGWEVHVEVHAGGVDGCPGQNSPTPDQTLIVTGIVWPLETAPFREQDGLIVTLLDFAGTLTNELPLRSTGESLDAFVARVCTDCAGDDPTGFVAFDLVAPVADGEISGHVYATHCASLDVR